MILDKEIVAEKYLDILEIAVAATKFCGYESKEYRIMIKSDEDSIRPYFRVIFDERYGSASNEPTYSLSTTISLNDDNNITSIWVHEHSGDYNGHVDKMSLQFEGYANTTGESTYFHPNNNGELEVITVTTEYRGHTNKGIDYNSSSKKTEVYEFDGNWKNLSSDMPKKSQENSKKSIR